MRILYSFPLRLARPGIGYTAWYQVSGLRDLGVEISLYTGSCEKQVQGLRKIVETLKVGPVKMPIRFLGQKMAFAIHDKVVAKALESGRVKCDLVHCWPSGAQETFRVAKKLGITTILERPNCHTRFAYQAVKREHEKLGLDLPGSGTHAFRDWRLDIEEAEYELADYLLCPSDFVLKTFKDLGVGSDKLLRHQYGYDIHRYKYDESPSYDKKPFSAIFLGECGPRKGLHYALRSWLDSKASKTGKFYICGNFVDGYKDSLMDMLAHPSVEHLGFVDNVTELLRKCNVLILPSIEEGSALVTYEARACGCVLLVSLASGAICEHMENALVHDVGDCRALTGHLDLCYSNPEKFNEMRYESIKTVDRLTWGHAANRLKELYISCIGR